MGTFLGLKALHDGIEAIPDSVWHQIPYFRPPEEKEKERRGSRDKQTKRSARRSRSHSATYAESDPGVDSSRKANSRSSKAPSSDLAPEAPGFRPAAVGAQPRPADINAPNNYPNAAGLTDPFANKSAPAPLPGYSDGPPPDLVAAQSYPQASHPASPYTPPYPLNQEQTQLAYRGPRHSIAVPMSNQQYYPPPQRGDDYPRSSYDPSRYQPAGDYGSRGESRGPANDEQVGNYYGGDDRYGGRAASTGPRARYDDDDYDDRRDDRSRHRRSKSRSSHHRHRDDDSDEEGGERGVMNNVKSKFDTSESALGASALGAIVGGIIGHKVGKSPLATAAGVAVGGLGVNAWEAHRHHKKELRREEEPYRHHSSRGSDADPVDYRTRKDLEYYGARADEDRSRREIGRGGYDDDDSAYDSGEDRRRRKRSSSRRRRDDDYDR